MFKLQFKQLKLAFLIFYNIIDSYQEYFGEKNHFHQSMVKYYR